MARPAAQNQGAHLEAAVLRVLRSGRYIGGPEVAAFEKALAAYVGADHAVGTASGTAALHAVLLALGVGAGDEVVLPAYTFCATLEAVLHVGATPVLVDIDADHLLDVDAVAAATTARTRAVVAVHLFGRRASVPALRARVPAHVAIIEDSAQAFGPHRPEGCAACFSFFPAKVLGAAGDAGAVVTADGALGARVRAIVNHGREAGVSQTLGHNFRLDALQAALLREKLPHVPGMRARRRWIAAQYRAGWAERELGLPRDQDGHAWQCFGITVAARDALAAALAGEGIASAVYYDPPLHQHPAFVERARFGALPRAERAARCSLCLPIYPELHNGEVERIIDAVRGFFIG